MSGQPPPPPPPIRRQQQPDTAQPVQEQERVITDDFGATRSTVAHVPTAARLIVISGKGGGVGKTSTTAHLAEACARAGLRTIAIDDKSQGDLRKRLNVREDRTLYQIAKYWDGRPETLEQWIVKVDGLESDWIVGPNSESEDYDDDLIPDSLYGRIVDVLLMSYDVVVVDTHPATKRSTGQHYTTWIPRLIADPRHAAVVVAEWDRAKLQNAREWTTNLVNAGIDPNRVFFLGLVTDVDDKGALSVDNVLSKFTMVRTLPPIPRSQAVRDANNGLGSTPLGGFDDIDYRSAIRAAAFDITGDERLDVVEEPRRRWWPFGKGL